MTEQIELCLQKHFASPAQRHFEHTQGEVVKVVHFNQFGKLHRTVRVLILRQLGLPLDTPKDDLEFLGFLVPQETWGEDQSMNQVAVLLHLPSSTLWLFYGWDFWSFPLSQVLEDPQILRLDTPPQITGSEETDLPPPRRLDQPAFPLPPPGWRDLVKREVDPLDFLWQCVHDAPWDLQWPFVEDQIWFLSRDLLEFKRHLMKCQSARPAFCYAEKAWVVKKSLDRLFSFRCVGCGISPSEPRDSCWTFCPAAYAMPLQIPEKSLIPLTQSRHLIPSCFASPSLDLTAKWLKWFELWRSVMRHSTPVFEKGEKGGWTASSWWCQNCSPVSVPSSSDRHEVEPDHALARCPLCQGTFVWFLACGWAEGLNNAIYTNGRVKCGYSSDMDMDNYEFPTRSLAESPLRHLLPSSSPSSSSSKDFIVDICDLCVRFCHAAGWLYFDGNELGGDNNLVQSVRMSPTYSSLLSEPLSFLSEDAKQTNTHFCTHSQDELIKVSQ